MKVSTKLAWIGAGYALAAAGGVAAVTVNELFMPADIAETSGGMVAFGDMILFVLATGFFSLAPTWFVLKLGFEKAPRALLIGLAVIAALGPLSWLAMMLVSAGGPHFPLLLGPLIAFGAAPRIVAGPILVAVEGLAFFLAPDRGARRLIATAMLLELAPLGLFTAHMLRGIVR
jgi:hypothetical protein